MNQKRIWFILIVLSIIAVGAAAQDDPPDGEETGPPVAPEAIGFVGSEVCLACHEAHYASWDATTHAHNFLKADEEMVQGDLSEGVAPVIAWPGGEERPLELADIDYVITGHYTQQYVSIGKRDDGEDAFYVLPVKWSIPQVEGQDGAWTAYHTDDWTDPARDWRTACAGCHTTGLTPALLDAGWTFDDVELNVGCEACHGAGRAHIEKPSEGHVYNQVDAQVCGQCHSVGSSPDGAYGYPVGYAPGEALDATVFTPAPVDDTSVWWPTGHAKISNNYQEWLTSAHADATDEYAAGVPCAACHDVHAEVCDDGQQQPFMLRDDPDTLCVDCHSNKRTEDGQWIDSAWQMLQGLQVVDQVEGAPSQHFVQMRGVSCTTCHMSATVQTGEFGELGTHTMRIVMPGELAPGEPDTCSACHTDLGPAALQQLIDGTQANVSNRLRTINSTLETTEAAPPDWVLEIVNFVEADGSHGIHNQGYTDSLLYAAELELGLVEPPETEIVVVQKTAQDPDECIECHQEEYDDWLTSPHAQASLQDNFQEDYAKRGRPGFCMQCHASGYNPATDAYVFEGVVCSNCHLPETGSEHPPASMTVEQSAEQCGECHSGAHAPTYDEWLASPHEIDDVDCVDCHTPHDNGLLLNEINTTCGSCHAEALVDEVHMGEDMNCKDCHMPRRLAEDGVHVVATGHTMYIDPSTCAECHGKAHVLTSDKSAEPTTTEEEHAEIQRLETEIEDLEKTAQTNWDSGIVGGAFGMFVVALIAGFIIIRGKLL